MVAAILCYLTSRRKLLTLMADVVLWLVLVLLASPVIAAIVRVFVSALFSP